MFLGYLSRLYWYLPILPHVTMCSIAEYSIVLPEQSSLPHSITTVDRHVNSFHAVGVVHIAAINFLRCVSCTSAKCLSTSSH